MYKLLMAYGIGLKNNRYNYHLGDIADRNCDTLAKSV